MEMITKQEAVEALKELFDYENHKENNEVKVSEREDGSAGFMIHKCYLERFEVIDKLYDFFNDKVIENGQCRIGSITFVYTMFFIEDKTTEQQ